MLDPRVIACSSSLWSSGQEEAVDRKGRPLPTSPQSVCIHQTLHRVFQMSRAYFHYSPPLGMAGFPPDHTSRVLLQMAHGAVVCFLLRLRVLEWLSHTCSSITVLPSASASLSAVSITQSSVVQKYWGESWIIHSSLVTPSYCHNYCSLSLTSYCAKSIHWALLSMC